MKRRTRIKGDESRKRATAKALLVMGVLGCGAMGNAQDPRAPLTPELAAQLSQNADHGVIVILKNKVAGELAARDQAPLMDELRQVKAARIKPFRLVNAFAATVSEGELARLKAHPAVDRVLPDVVIRRKPSASTRTLRGDHAKIPEARAESSRSVPALNTLPGACSSSPQGQLDPEGLSLTNTASDDPGALTARSLGYTGAGVKVASLADGIDVNNINFIRADGTSVFVDYRDFGGDGPTAPDSGGEAFIDYNAIAGQGIHVYDVSQFSAQTDPAPCNIRIEGVAPGASLVGLKVFSDNNATTISFFLAAIEYAVQTAHVDVLNESVGGNLYPDTPVLDAFNLFNDAAVAAGVTVVVSSGDAGPTNTIGTPASNPNFIDVGATTSFRVYAQTNYGAARYFATTGWLNDNISALSSSGFTQTGRTLDLVAPGDFAFASCDASPDYSDCFNLLFAPSDVELSGGTSLSAPLTAGAAALVIEAYRGAHHGRSPSPALVKQILTSTATDLGVPANEQGAGLLNSYKAVLLAKSIDGGAPTGQTLLISENQLHATGLPESKASWDVTVTNVSASPQTVTVNGRTFGPPQNVQSGSVQIDPPGTQFTYANGTLYTYETFTFQVPPGAARLYASIAYFSTLAFGKLSLIDPNGKFAAHSLPQGIGDAGSVDVRQPAAGTWTGVVFENSDLAAATPGPVLWQVYTQQFVPFGSVSPDAFSLAPGASQTLEISADTPAAPGDAAGSIVFTASRGGTDPYLGPESNSIPVTLRSLVDIDHGGAFSGAFRRGGAFRGTVNGGNGRSPQDGQVAYYQFNAGPGRKSITASVSLTNDPQENLGLYLIDPTGVSQGIGTNFDAVTGVNSLSATADVLDPLPGTWTVIAFVGTVAGNEISQPFTGTVTLDQTDLTVSAPAVPHDPGTKLAAGVPVTIPITVSNLGPAPEDVFIDARLNATAKLTLSDLVAPNNFQFTLPVPCCTFPLWLVPSETTSVQVSANANVPVEFDFGSDNGDPDILSVPVGSNGAQVLYSPAPSMVQPGLWYAGLAEVGPFGTAGAPQGQATISLVAQTQAFDPALTASTGDFWLQSINPAAPFAPVSIGPGQAVTINVTIMPSGAPGTVVSGVLNVSTLAYFVVPFGTASGNEAVKIPYRYRIQ